MTSRGSSNVMFLKVSIFIFFNFLCIAAEKDYATQQYFAMYIFFKEGLLLYRHECFNGKYTTRKIHTKLNLGLEWQIFHILTSKEMDDFTDIKFNLSLKLFLNSLVYDRNIFGSSRKC